MEANDPDGDHEAEFYRAILTDSNGEFLDFEDINVSDHSDAEFEALVKRWEEVYRHIDHYEEDVDGYKILCRFCVNNWVKRHQSIGWLDLLRFLRRTDKTIRETLVPTMATCKGC